MKIIKTLHFFIGVFALCLFLVLQSNAQSVFNVLEKRFIQYKEANQKERVQVITDRDLYAPGELIWFNATVYDILSPNVSSTSKEISICLANSGSTEVYSKTFSTKEGNVNGFVELPAELPQGIYYFKGKFKISGGWNYYNKEILIKNQVAPQFLIKASFADREYIPGDEISMTLEFQDFYNEPKRNVTYKIDFFNGNKQISGTTGKTNKTGLSIVNLKVPLKLNSGLFTYRISAESKNSQTQLSGKFPVISDKIFIDFYPEGGQLVNGISTKINLFSYDECGYPRAIEGDLIEDGKVISSFYSDSRGIGSFVLIPDATKSYHVQVKRPLLLDKRYELPEIGSKAIAFKVLEKTPSLIRYKLINSYISSKHIFLIGVSNGDIFWSSEHEVDREMSVDIDLSKATGRLAHFTLLNAALKIEGEHVTMIAGKGPNLLTAKEKNISNSPRGEIVYDLMLPSGKNGIYILKAVNSPWVVDDLIHQNVQTISLPYDFGQQLVFNTKVFRESDLSDEVLETYTNYYFPENFGWDKVLKTKGAFARLKTNQIVHLNRVIENQFKGTYSVEQFNGVMSHTNFVGDRNFLKSNPKYISQLAIVKKEQIPEYRTLLEHGTPVRNVIQTIKPYNLEGSNIVFVGGARSINSPGGALIVIDGIKSGTNAYLLDNINPVDVEKIFCSTKPSDVQRYSGFASAGLIDITMKSGGKKDKKPQKVDENTQFSAPEYINTKAGSPSDFRSTLFWKVSPGEEFTSITFYNSDLLSKVSGMIYFIPNEGQPTSKSFIYEVK